MDPVRLASCGFREGGGGGAALFMWQHWNHSITTVTLLSNRLKPRSFSDLSMHALGTARCSAFQAATARTLSEAARPVLF